MGRVGVSKKSRGWGRNVKSKGNSVGRARGVVNGEKGLV